MKFRTLKTLNGALTILIVRGLAEIGILTFNKLMQSGLIDIICLLISTELYD